MFQNWKVINRLIRICQKMLSLCCYNDNCPYGVEILIFFNKRFIVFVLKNVLDCTLIVLLLEILDS